MTIAYPNPSPYILLFIIIFVVFIAAAVKYPSLRRPTKRNLLIYLAVALALSLPMYQAYDLSLGPTAVTYQAELEEDKFYADQINQFNVSCSSLSMRKTSFDLTITAVNASFVATSPYYVLLNDMAINLPFSFREVHEKQTVPIAFKIDDNVTACQFTMLMEPRSDRPIVTQSTSRINCVWNSELGCYRVSVDITPAVL